MTMKMQKVDYDLKEEEQEDEEVEIEEKFVLNTILLYYG